ncbi:MAG: arginase [Parafilimonas sp.]
MAFHSFDTLVDFLHPLNLSLLSENKEYKDTQLGRHISFFENSLPDISSVDLVLIGCNETRGSGEHTAGISAADAVRKQFYKLYHWHNEIKIADIGNIKRGATLYDTYVALKIVFSEILNYNKRIIIIGGSNDLMLAQYNVYAEMKKIIEATCIDAFINLDAGSDLPADNFLIEMLTREPNFLRHYNHIGFQSYFVHRATLETIDRLRFDCYRAGIVKENILEMEPVIRNSELFGFDISAIQNSDAPANLTTPNGFTGEDACTLMQYAGMSLVANMIGIYGYNPSHDVHELTAKQISQMLWYFMEGMMKCRLEAPLSERNKFNEYKLIFAEVETAFRQNKKTGRWWMQLPNGKFIPCSYKDYKTACNNEIPERWMRAVERG